MEKNIITEEKSPWPAKAAVFGGGKDDLSHSPNEIQRNAGCTERNDPNSDDGRRVEGVVEGSMGGGIGGGSRRRDRVSEQERKEEWEEVVR
jgi:hypothetical protein